MVHPGGRPRTVSLPPDQMIALGEEMIEWVIKHDPIHLSMFYSLVKNYTNAEWRVMTDAPEFSPYYEKALKLVGYKYLTKDSPVEPSLKQRWQRVYFKDLRKQEDEDAQADALRKKDIEGAKQSHYTIITDANLASKADLSASNLSSPTN